MSLTRKKAAVSQTQIARERVYDELNRIEVREERKKHLRGEKPPVWTMDDPTLLPFFAVGPNLEPCERGLWARAQA